MAKPVTMPQLGESVTEGTITRWLKAEGDEVAMDEPLAEVDTDKVNAELPSPVAGRIEKLLIPEGATVDVGTEIALVTIAGESGSPAALPRENVAVEASTEEFTAAGTEAVPVASGVADRSAASQTNGHGSNDTRFGARVVREPGGGLGARSAQELRLTRSSPVVRRLAAEHDVDIREIPGSGTGGRVTRKDIEGYLEERGAEVREYAPPGLREERAAFAPSEASPEPGARRERVPVYEGDRVEDLTSIRRAIASRMSTSKREAPHAWTMVEVDVTGLVALREREKAAFAERESVKLTYLPFIVQAVVESLKEHPILNSVWDGDRIVLRKRINVGIAVDLEDALIVPVILDADELNVLGLARRIDDLVRRARNRQLGPEDVSGGTFTVNNPGSLGSLVSTPIINYPQAAILSAEAVVKRPVVIDEAIAIRSMMNLEVSFDHRIFDGGQALKFLNAVKRRLESIGPRDVIG
ncbi:MAG TPA: dihydrolipoamide acetyltransferase family protein [Rubrobacteraceae bacterium]|nr:dihydrolipoamide acetyltransferase family protein [Rubrobacteraceae bacterium]